MRSPLPPFSRFQGARGRTLGVALAAGVAALWILVLLLLGLWGGLGAPIALAVAIALMLACVWRVAGRDAASGGAIQAAEHQGFDARHFLAEAVEAAFIMDLNGMILAGNAQFAALAALDMDEATSCAVAQAVPPPIVEAIATALDYRLETTGAIECRNRAGEWLIVDLTWQSCSYDETPALAFTMLDITERRRREIELAVMAFEDPLTRIGNRASIQRRLDRLKSDLSEGPDASFAVMALDLDRFKPVNDEFGHSAGDRLLIEVAGRIVGALPGNAFVGRNGGDEFVVVVGPRVGLAAARQFAQRILEAVRQPVALDGRTVTVGVSVGVALAPANGEEGRKLLDAADEAMYRAKRAGDGVAFCAPPHASDALKSVA